MLDLLKAGRSSIHEVQVVNGLVAGQPDPRARRRAWAVSSARSEGDAL